MTTESIAKQRGWAQLDVGLSNFDRKIPDGLEEKLKSGDFWCPYAAWDFYAQVWFEGRFKAHINQHCSHMATLEADSLSELMAVCSDEYGYD